MKKLIAILLTLTLLLGLCPMAAAAEAPAFTALEFLTTAFVSGTWTKGQTYSPAQKEYVLPFKAATTTQLTFQGTTVYDTEAYTAAAAYTNAGGETVTVPVNSGKITYLKDLPFGETVVALTLADRENAENKTVYTLRVIRPWDEAKTLKATSGITLVPDGRALSAMKYQSQPEGTVFRADGQGVASATTGTVDTVTCYRTYLLGTDGAFSLTLTGKTAYTRLRYSTDNGAAWTELPQGGGTTEKLPFPAESTEVKVLFEVLDDKTYTEKGGFADAAPTAYTLWVERVNARAELLTASVAGADGYPAVFDPALTSYVYVVPNGTTTAELRYTAPEGAAVTVGKKAADAGTPQTPEADGSYRLTLTTTAQYVNVTRGGVTRQYNFKVMARSAKPYADRVTDYLCPNSQYTNVTYGVSPETTLTGGLKSLGNWGGYITYYFDAPLTNDPRNAYGVDFYVYGNSNESNIGSMGELGQVWVSENGETWYALAGSEHYEDDVFWDYAVTYQKTADGKTAWTDNKGNSNDGTAQCGKWPDPAIYYMNDLAKGDSFTLRGILFSCQQGSIRGDSTTGSFAHAARFGYADYFANGTVGADVNPYVEAPTKSNGFDLAWAVDENGLPVDVSGKEFHYVKVVTGSNIWAGSFAEKSTECAGVVRTTAREAAVGKTALTGVTLTAGEQTRTVTFTPEQRVYDADVGTAETLTLTALGTEEGTNLYYNNHWGDGAAVTLTEGKTRLVRVLAQNGEREPVSYLLRLKGSTGQSTEPDPKPPVTPPQPTGTVTVRFSLLGDDKHGEGPAHTLKNGTLTPWITDRAVTVPAPATVLDVITAALAGEHTFTNAGGSYISAVDDLAEFDNGPLSGWMYTLNGTHPETDVARQTVQSGDRVILHYTDDYTAEQASERWTAVTVEQTPQTVDTDALLQGTRQALLTATPAAKPGSVGGEWAVLALTRSGDLPAGYADSYYAALEQTVTACKGVLHEKKYTEYARTVLALTALGADPAHVAGCDLLTPLSDEAAVAQQGINGPIWALIALDSGPWGTETLRQSYADTIAAARHSDGGWGLGTASEVDLTAMALQALAAHGPQSVLDAGLTWLAARQGADGGFGNCESTAQVVMALCALGLSPRDSRFVKNGKAPVDALLACRLSDGSFAHTGTAADAMATEQGTLALTALWRQEQKKPGLYDLRERTLLLTGDAGLPGKHKDVQKRPITGDVTFTDTQEKAVLALAARGILTGYPDGSFGPEKTVTRAEFAAMAVRALGLPTEQAADFTDVPAAAWYAAPVGSAAAYGIVLGVGDGKFAPQGTITKQEAAVMIARAAKLCGMDTALPESAVRSALAPFDDGAAVASWAREALAFCCRSHLLDDSGLTIEPGRAVTRLEMASMLYALLEGAKLL